MATNKTLLISMPFGALSRPALGISLLKATLDRQQLPCEIRYLNFAFAEFISGDDFNWITHELPYTAFAGDWTFTTALYGPDATRDARYLDQILRGGWSLSEADISRLLRVRQMVLPFLSHCLSAIPWSQYGVVGFSSTLEQNIASLALAKMIKDLHPDIAIVFGGANCEAEMGVELHNLFPFIDFVCTGEGENCFPPLVRYIVEGRGDKAVNIAGLVYRDHGRSVTTGPAEEVQVLDELPFPDYGDYFETVQESSAGVAVAPALLIETSRGCWWGAKSRCMFCGLNGEKIGYRSKTPDRAVAEFHYLAEKYNNELIEAVDNVLDPRYFSDVLPRLARADRPLDIFYEVKANLTKDRLRLLKAAGVHRIQPGVESLNDHVLKLMRKGTTTLQNVQILKWCRELGITVYWNLIYGFPGETAEDYAAQLDVFRLISFLDPPFGYGPVRLDRFSPYYQEHWKHGIRNVRPLPSYQFLYPVESWRVANLAYSFDYDSARLGAEERLAAPLLDFINLWRRGHASCLLASKVKDGIMVIVDSREGTVTETTLSPLERIIYERCDACCSIEEIAIAAAEDLATQRPGTPKIKEALAGLVAKRLMMTDGLRYLSLAIPLKPVQSLSYHVHTSVGG